MMNLCYDQKNDLLPITTIAKHFTRAAPNPLLYKFRNRINQTAVVPTVLLSEHAKRSIQIGGNDFWNDLPIEIKTNESLNGFKKQFKKYLLDQS